MVRSAAARAAPGSAPPATSASYQRAAECHEPPALVGDHPGHRLLRVVVLPRGQVRGQTRQGEVPPDADRTGTELRPPFVVDVGDVVELEPGALALGGQAQLDPRHVAGELPGRGEPVRRIAAEHGAAGVALKLVLAADSQVAGDRQEPARQPFGVGARVPDVVERAVVGLAHGDHPRLPGVERARADLSLHGADLVVDVDHRGLLGGWRLSGSGSGSVRRRRSRRPRASSVSSAISRGVQVRRNRSSQASTSCSGAVSTA